MNAPAHGVRAYELEAVLAIIGGTRVDLATEKATQAGLEEALLAGVSASDISREHRLGPGDIPDFLLFGRVVVEVKGGRHQAAPTLRQLERYSAYPQVTHLVLATSRAMAMPREVGGKPLVTVNLGKAWL